MKKGIIKDQRLAKIRWRKSGRRVVSMSIRRLPSLQWKKRPYFRYPYNTILTRCPKDRILAAMHEVGHMIVAHNMIPTDNIDIRIYQSDIGDWRGEISPTPNTTDGHIQAHILAAGFMAEVMFDQSRAHWGVEEQYTQFASAKSPHAKDYCRFINAYLYQKNNFQKALDEFMRDEVGQFGFFPVYMKKF